MHIYNISNYWPLQIVYAQKYTIAFKKGEMLCYQLKDRKEEFSNTLPG